MLHSSLSNGGKWGADGVKRSKKANGRLFLNKTWDEYPEQILLASTLEGVISGSHAPA